MIPWWAAVLAALAGGALVLVLLAVVVVADGEGWPTADPVPPEPAPICDVRVGPHSCSLRTAHTVHLCSCRFSWRGLPLAGLERVRDAVSRSRGDHAGPTRPITWSGRG